MKMEIKVKFTYEWHWGIPDGEEKFEAVSEWFDTSDQEALTGKMKHVFLEYTSNQSKPIQMVHDVDLPTHAYEDTYEMIADIEHGIRNIETIYVTHEYVLEHQGKYFKCEEIFLC